MRREASLKNILPGFRQSVWPPVIFLFSAQPADQSTETSDFVSQLLLAVFSRLGLLEGGPEQYAGLLEALSFPVRKCAHITEYAVFYLTVLYGMGQWEQKRKPWLIKSFAVTFFYACTDEIISFLCRESREAYGCVDRLYWRQPDHGCALVSI